MLLLAFGGINLVGENVFGVGSGDGEIQSDQQLHQRFTFATHQHGQGVVSIVGHSYCFPHRTNLTDSNLALFDQLSDGG